MKEGARREAAWVAALLAVVAAATWRSLGLSEMDFATPFNYAGDSLQYLAVFRTILLTGWYTDAPGLGAPFGALHYDAPVPDGLFLAFVAALAPFTDNPAIAFNVLFVGSFFLVSAAFYTAARLLEVPRPLAAVGALAYGWLPFHFLRADHLFYTLYFLPPLVIAVAARLADDGLPGVRAWLTWRKVALFLLAGAAGVYNAFFMVVVLAFCALAAAIAHRDRARLLHGAAAAALITASLVANLAPTLVHHARAGPNAHVAQRHLGESEVYGLKLAQLLLPNAAHPIAPLGRVTQQYNATALNVNENATASLGAIGAGGFLLALALLLLRAPAGAAPGPRLDLLAKANACVFLVATVGGLGALFALAVSPQLRALNRASVVIAAISLLVLLLAIARWAAGAAGESARRRRIGSAAAALLAVWLVDQAPMRRLQAPDTRAQFAADARFVSEVAALLPPGAMVLQLPYTEYPERAPHHKEDHYGLIRPYLHASSLRWSYGAMRGREGDGWLRALSTRPPAEQLARARASGFAGLYVERRAYKDNAAQFDRDLRALLGPPAVQRSDGATAFWRLEPSGSSPVDIFPAPELVEGFYGWERVQAEAWAWSRGDATLALSNPMREPRPVKLEVKLHTLRARTVVIGGQGIALAAGEKRLVSVALTLAPGRNAIRITTPEPAAPTGTRDPRLLAFALIDPRVDAAR